MTTRNRALLGLYYYFNAALVKGNIISRVSQEMINSGTNQQRMQYALETGVSNAGLDLIRTAVETVLDPAGQTFSYGIVLRRRGMIHRTVSPMQVLL